MADGGGAVEGTGERVRPPRGPGSRRAAFVVCALLALYGSLQVSLERGLAYDEAMHAGLPAQRMALALRAGRPGEAADALLDCQRYPFVYPVVLAAVQLVSGPSEAAMRRTGRCVWALTCFGVFLLASETVRRRAPRKGKDLAPWMALILALTSPLALAYSGTVFLEVPFACAMAFALHAWLRRDGSARAEHAAGALFALAFFTKFNYGVLLAAVLAVDLLLDGVRARDRGQGRAFLVRCLHLLVVPAASMVLWFVVLRGPEHRRAFLDFLAENSDPSMAVGLAQRWVDWCTHFALSPLVLGLMGVGFLADLCPSLAIARTPARVARLVTVAFVLALGLHGFHLDRFLLPVGVGLWCTAGLGLARIAPDGRPSRLALGLILASLVYVSTPLANLMAVKLAGFWPPDEPVNERARTYVREVLKQRRSLAADRPLPVAGLLRPEADFLLDLIASEVGPDERVAWLGIPSEVSRGVLHAGLLARGGSLERFLAEAPVPMLLETQEADPGLDAEELRAWAAAYDVVLFTQPVDLKDRPGRRFLQAYVDRLRSDPAWHARRLGHIRILKGPMVLGDALDVTLFALRRLE